MKLIKQKEKFMNMKNIHRFYFFICLFPTWIFFKDITFYEKLSYFTPFLFFYLVLFYFYKKNFFNKIKNDRVYGYGAPAKAVTLINYFNILTFGEFQSNWHRTNSPSYLKTREVVRMPKLESY